MPHTFDAKKSAAPTPTRANDAAVAKQGRGDLRGLDYEAQAAHLAPGRDDLGAPPVQMKADGAARSAPVQMKTDSAATTTTAAPAPESPAPTDAAALSAPKVAAAIAFNTKKGLGAPVWAQVAKVVGSKSDRIDATLVNAIAAWQRAKGLPADAMVGDITMQWLSMETEGKGLDAYVKSNDILYLGFNPKSKDVEHKQLTSAGAKVTAIKGEKEQDTIGVDGKVVDLTTPEGIDKFVASLQGMDKGRQELLKDFLASSDGMGKDEMAGFARALHSAETGKALFKRAVISGHSNGRWIWGDENGGLDLSKAGEVQAIFPKACGMVEDLMMSACNTGQSGKLAQYRALFPNVRSIWAYVGYSPDASGGSLQHIGSWEQATRGAMDEGKVHGAREKTGRGGGKNDKHVAVATYDADGKETSYETKSEYAAQDFDTLKAQVDAKESLYTKAFDQGLVDKPALDVYYTELQNLVGTFGSRLSDRAKYEAMLQRTLYLRHWDNIAKKFTEVHGTEVRAGYVAAKATPVTYAGLKRDKALAAIAAYPKAGDTAHTLLTTKLKNLDGIPMNWN